MEQMEKNMVEDENIRKRIEENKPLIETSKANTKLVSYFSE